jgi:hypothetical protein
MTSVMGIHHGLDFPEKSQTITVEGTFIYDGSNDDPGYREFDWWGELVSVEDKSKRYALPYRFRKCLEYYSKSELDIAFKKPFKAKLLVVENSDDQFSYLDGKADLIWGVRSEKVNTGSIEGLNNWYYSSWKYPLRFWVPLTILLVLLFLAREELKKENPVLVFLSVSIPALPPIINAFWFYFYR